MRHTYIGALALTMLMGANPAFADPADRTRPERHGAHEHDYSRFSDGPRRVPTPRGASATRARALGLGTREAASRLLRRPVEERLRRAAGGESPDRLLWPVDEGRYVRGYGYVRTTRPDLLHRGVDIAAEEGSVVRAVADGIVAYSDNGIRGMGNCVLIVHGNGWVSLYAHNARTTVQPGWRVRRGERIALVGSTGISRGPHVHFELREDGRAIDPLALFDGGPPFVERVAARAAEAGRVAAPQPVRGSDRRDPPPLSPWRAEGDAPAPVAARSADAEETSGDEDLTDRIGSLPVGSQGLARRLLRFRPTAPMIQAAGGRHFRNLLWPLRGGRLERAERMVVSAGADEPTAVRAAADGVVAFVGAIPGRGRSVIVLHPMGWVTIYGDVGEVHVEPGQHVQRGEWVAHTAEGRALRFELRVDGRAEDPRPLLVQLPDAD